MPRPEPIQFECEWITPAFLGGPDPKRAELSEGAFLGALRFWTRAMLGAVIGTQDIGKLAWMEGRLWGASTTAAAVSIRVLNRNCQAGVVDRFKQQRGVEYLAGLGILRQGREAFRPKGKFCIEVGFRTTNEDLRRAAAGVTWLVCHCGGVGSRSRRGFGCFALCDAAFKSAGLDFGAAPHEGLAGWYLVQLEEVYRAFAAFAGSNAGGLLGAAKGPLPAFTSFARWCGSLGPPANLPYGYAGDALDAAGLSLRNSRSPHSKPSGRPPTVWANIRRTAYQSRESDDYRKVVSRFFDKRLTAIGTPRLDNACFGLPLSYRSNRRSWDWTDPVPAGKQQPEVTAEVNWTSRQPGSDEGGRRASPLIIRPVRLDNGGFTTLALLFPAALIPDTGNLWLKAGAKWPDPASTHAPHGPPPDVCLTVPGFGAAERFVRRHGQNQAEWLLNM